MAIFDTQLAYHLCMSTDTELTTGLDAQACYAAMKSHDARFDGRFFVGVSSTGIYCRPVCRVKLPKFENCTFYAHAALAETAGYRPCLRCRPEMAPRHLPWSTQDASRTLALQAARCLDDPDFWQTDSPRVSQLAAHLGVSDRHLRRLFAAHFGVSPLQYLQTRRLLTAKQLLTDTRMPIAQVALHSGFASVRRFSSAFISNYRLQPSAVRRAVQADTNKVLGSEVHSKTFSTVKLSYRPPYDVQAMLAFFQKRCVTGIEFVTLTTQQQEQQLAGWTLSIESESKNHTGWVVVEFQPTDSHVLLQLSDTLRPVLATAIRRVRDLLDLDADPMAINAVLGNSFDTRGESNGLRVPGSLNGFELAVRAILGQQVTVAAGRTFVQRLVDAFGEPIESPYPALNRLFPSAERIAQLNAEDLGQLGIVTQRQNAILALAKAVSNKQLNLSSSANLADTVHALHNLPGVGDWTAQYIAMRALRWPDAFVAGDVAVQKAMGLLQHLPKLSATKLSAAAELASQSWRPWRSYAVMRAWSSLEKQQTEAKSNAINIIAY